MDTWETLAFAIEKQRQVLATYNGRPRAFCPHALGMKGDKRHVLVYQFDAARRIGERPTTGWRCLEVDGLEDVSLNNGEWHTAPNVFNPQSCLDEVQIVVRPFPPLQRQQVAN